MRISQFHNTIPFYKGDFQYLENSLNKLYNLKDDYGDFYEGNSQNTAEFLTKSKESQKRYGKLSRIIFNCFLMEGQYIFQKKPTMMKIIRKVARIISHIMGTKTQMKLIGVSMVQIDQERDQHQMRSLCFPQLPQIHI